MKSNIIIGLASDVGRARKINEDATCVLVHPEIRSGLNALLAVADGMGGHKAGQVASNMAVDLLCQCYSNTKVNDPFNRLPSDFNEEADLLKINIEQLNTEIYSHSLSTEELSGMGTTLIAALLTDDRLLIGHVGDSRGYLISNNQISQITEDHSWVAEQSRLGLLQPDEVELHPWRNVISRAIGTQKDISVDINKSKINIGDSIILCSDGLSSMVTEDEMLEMLNRNISPQTACENLVNLANLRGGPDNITVVVARRSEPPITVN